MLLIKTFMQTQTSHSRLEKPERRLLCPERDGPLHVSYDHVLRSEIKWRQASRHAHGTVRYGTSKTTAISE